MAAARKDVISEPKTFVGTVKPLRKSIVGSAAPGRVEEYLINDGDFVQKGQPIAHLRRGIIAAEKKAAEAELRLRTAQLAEMEGSLADEIAQAKAKLQSAEAMLAFRNSKRERQKSLGTSVTKEELEESSALASQALGTVDEMKAALRLLTEGPREQRNEQMRAGVEVQAAEVERLTEQYERHTMFSPFDGWVSAEHTEVGQWVMQGDPIAEIVELSMVDVEINVLEDYVARLDTTTVGDVELSALGGRRFEGVVATINPQADARARTFPVKVRVKNEIDARGPRLLAGMFARVTLAVGDPAEVTLVPKDSVVLSGKSPMVFVVDTMAGKSHVRPVPITLGASRGLWISVGRTDLKPGELVVIEGNERLRPMQEVRAEQAKVEYLTETAVPVGSSAFPAVTSPEQSATPDQPTK